MLENWFAKPPVIIPPPSLKYAYLNHTIYNTVENVTFKYNPVNITKNEFNITIEVTWIK